LVPDAMDLVRMDLPSLAVASAIHQLGRISLARDAERVALVKPMFELRLAHAPRDRRALGDALGCAAAGAERAGWRVCGYLDSPVPGGRGAIEVFLHAQRAGPDEPPRDG